MGTDRRERKKANREARRAAELAAEARQRRIRFVRNAVILVVAIVVAGLLLSLAACSDDDGDGATGERQDRTEANEGAGAAATGECPPEDGVDEPVVDFEAAPPQCTDPDATYRATIETSKGTVVVELDTDRTPATTNNFVTLARYGYYDGTALFRTEAQTGIIQGGSPHTQDNSDPGPGYTIDDEALPFTAEDYAPGALAMARTAAPDSASGQFFFLATEGGRYLGDQAAIGPSAGTYVVFGRTVEGLDVLQEIAALDDGTGAPSEPVEIESVEITES